MSTVEEQRMCEAIRRLQDGCYAGWKALFKYGHHKGGCARGHRQGNKDCTCGLDDAMDALESLSTEAFVD